MFKRVISTNFSKYAWQQQRWYSVKMDTYSQKKDYYGGLFPDKLLKKKLKVPDALYMVKEETARIIDKHLDPFLKQSPCDTVLEMNPGIALFTRKLLDREDQFKKILLMEGMDFFVKNLEEMHSLYPERVKVKDSDFTYLWKLLFQDRIDDGSRVAEILRDVPKKTYTDESNFIVFGAVGCYAFYKHLISSIIFQNSIFALGRAEMYFVIPPPVYLYLTCCSDIGFMIFRSTSLLFRMLFEYQFITRLPRNDFLPAQSPYDSRRHAKLGRVLSVDPDYLYLVRMIPRKNIFDFVAPEDLPAMWYFVRQNYFSRRNRIIPNLEKWIPGCGPRLILNSKQSEVAKPLYPNENVSKLPMYSSQCCTISNNDFYPNINIYTQFGDLSPSQLLTLFCEFRKWPEYKDSPFLASFENTMLKMDTIGDESVDGISDEEDETPTDVKDMLDPSRSKKKRNYKKEKQT